VKTESQRVCRACGVLLPLGSDFCPACLLRGAAADETDNDDAPSDPADSLADLHLDHYEILLRGDGKPIELGHGAMGVTYKAIDVNLRCYVALKIIGGTLIGDEGACRRFVREARAAASVRDPNVASVFHLGTRGSNYFYAMEFVAGEPLDRVIRCRGRLEIKEALHILCQVATGLEAIWKHQLVHRDIKPSNIMVGFENERITGAKIIDLGLAKGTSEDQGSSIISTHGTFIGTAAYASPEQFAGLITDIRSDLYSLGVTLWEMVSGELPFAGTPSELMYSHQRRAPPIDRLIGVPQPVIALLQRMLDKDPAERFQNPSELIQAIPRVTEAISAGRRLRPTEFQIQRSGVLTTSGLQPQGKRLGFIPGIRRIRKWPIGVVAMAVLLIGLFGFGTYRESFSGTPISRPVLREKSIAVLPFASLSANQDDSLLADGIQDEILNNLARVAQLKVISRTSVRQYRPETKPDVREIAQALGVANVLEGTVRREGDRIRITTELIDAPNKTIIWADSFDRDLTDILAIHSEIAQTIANKLNTTLSPDEELSIAAKPTDSVKAYDLYLKAKLIIDGAVIKWDTDALEEPLRDAVSLLEQAVQLDPNFALAYCASAVAHDFLYLLYDHTAERRAQADAALNKALRLRRGLPEVHLTYAKHLLWAYGDYEAARVQISIAKPGLPNDSRISALEADIDRHEGKFEKSIQGFNDALVRDPLNENLISNLALCYGYVRQYRASEKMFSRLAELAPDLSMIKVQKATVVDFNERGDTGAVESALAELPKPQADDREALSLHLAIAVTREEWQQAEDLIERLDGGDDEGEFGYGNVPVPVGCYSILIAVLRAEQLTPAFNATREELSNRVQKSPTNGALLSSLALVDAILGNKEKANQEADHALELTPVAKDAMNGPEILKNVAATHVWTGELEKGFTEISMLAKMPKGLSYGELKCDQFWAPVKKDPRYERILAELQPPSPKQSVISNQ
jgi:serine/threonine protein kinase/Flp pilus assembly protein TadD